MAVEIKKIYPSWVNVYAGGTLYHDQSKLLAGGEIRTGSLDSYNTWFGVPTELLELLRTSKIPAILHLYLRAETNALEVQVFPHKSVVNPGNARPGYSGSMLNYFAIGGAPHTFPKWVSISDTTLRIASKLLSGEISGFALSGTTDDRLTASNTGEFIPYFEVVGEWNTPPGKPILTYPVGGETVNGVKNITWVPSTDAESPQNTLTYQVQLTKNNGQTWATIAERTVAGAASYAYDFATESESSLAKIRVRAFDGLNYGEWSESDGVFSILHNIAPFAPTNLVPSGSVVNRTITNKLSWQHNDSPNDTQSKADVRWRAQGALNWNNVVVNDATQETYLASNVIPNGVIEWQVRTYDRLGLVGPWSSLAVFTAAEPTNAPIIIRPSSQVNTLRPVVEWTGGAQQSYQVIVDDALNRPAWSSGEVFSVNKAATVGVNLVNGATYTIKVRIKDGSGLFSSYTSKKVVVSYTPPAKPIVTAFSANGHIAFNISTPNPVGIQPTVIAHEVYKRINNEWTRIAYDVGSSFNDYHVKSGQSYDYYVMAIGDNDTTTNSDVVTQSTAFRGSWIHAIQDAEATLQYFQYNGTGYETSYEPESSVMKFAGRTRPVVHFGNYEDYSLSVRIQSVEGMGDMDALQRFVRNREIVCYRDSDGNLVVGHILALNVTKNYRVSSATITIIETDFNEEV